MMRWSPLSSLEFPSTPGSRQARQVRELSLPGMAGELQQELRRVAETSMDRKAKGVLTAFGFESEPNSQLAQVIRNHFATY